MNQGDQAIVTYATASEKKLLEEFIKKTGMKCAWPEV
jgi:hypothetical protein